MELTEQALIITTNSVSIIVAIIMFANIQLAYHFQWQFWEEKSERSLEGK